MTLLAYLLFVQMVWKLKTALILLCRCFPMSLIIYFCKEKCLPYFPPPTFSFCSFVPSLQTQRDGLIFIYDMTNSSYGNFDYELCVKILNLLKVTMRNTLYYSQFRCEKYNSYVFWFAISFSQGAFPARLKCVFIVSSPLWFRAPFAVLRLFVREKLRERVRVSIFY